MLKSILLAATCLMSFGAVALEIPAAFGSSRPLPEEYRVAVPPAVFESPPSTKERGQAFNGTTYDVIAPIFTGSDGNTSFIRLANVNAVAATFQIVIVGSPSGTVYGTATYAVPSMGTPQYGYSEVLQRAGVTSLAPQDTGLSFYLRSSHFFTGYPHVVFNLTSRFFENMTRCKFVSNVDYSGMNQLLGNVHTSVLSGLGFPAVVALHNHAATASNFTVHIYEARNGTLKGTLNLTAAANTTYSFPFSYFEQEVGWVPTEQEGHANLVFVPQAGTQYTLTIGQAVYNQTFQAYANMSQYCGSNY